MSLALSAGQRAPHRVALQGCQNSLGSSPAVCADGFGKGDGENANVCSPCDDNEITDSMTNKCTACLGNTEPNVAQNACGELPTDQPHCSLAFRPQNHHPSPRPPRPAPAVCKTGYSGGNCNRELPLSSRACTGSCCIACNASQGGQIKEACTGLNKQKCATIAQCSLRQRPLGNPLRLAPCRVRNWLQGCK
jgi:hypothetical protein